MQLLVRCNGNLAVIKYRRRPAAQRDPVVADDIDAHDWVLLIDRRRFRRDPTHALFADQSQSIPDNVVALFGRIRAWNCSAQTQCAQRQLRYMLKSSRWSMARPASDRALPSAVPMGSSSIPIGAIGWVTRERYRLASAK